MSKMIERVCQCGCGETFMARARDIKRGWGKYKNRSHASSGSNNPYWRGGRSTNRYYYKLRAIVQHPLEQSAAAPLRALSRVASSNVVAVSSVVTPRRKLTMRTTVSHCKYVGCVPSITE